MDNNQLTIADLATIHSILETACDRGAFKASEMRQVGEMYEKLGDFVKTIQAQATQQSPNTGAPNPVPPQGEF